MEKLNFRASKNKINPSLINSFAFRINKYRKHTIMKKITLWLYSFFLFFGLLFSTEAWATHLRAGDLTAVRLAGGGLSYEFTITIYTDDEGVPPDKEIEVVFGDNSPAVMVKLISSVPIANQTTKNTYKVVHVFAGPGEYKVSTTIKNRNAGFWD
jgi:hypothetical protein